MAREDTLLRHTPYSQHTLLSNPVISYKVSQSDQEAQQQQNMKSERKEKHWSGKIRTTARPGVGF